MKTNTGLGKGLNAIFDTQHQSNALNVPGAGSIVEVELSRIKPNPSQPRTMFEHESLQELSSSIARLGVIQPITIKEVGTGQYMIISGERRYRASQMAGLTTIPAYVRNADDDQVLEMALVENIQRQDLNAMEIAITLQRLMEECSLTQDTLSERVGKKRSTVANYMRLLRLPAEVQLAIRQDQLGMGHARALVSVEDIDVQLALVERIIAEGLSVRQVEELVAAISEAQISSNVDAGTGSAVGSVVEHDDSSLANVQSDSEGVEWNSGGAYAGLIEGLERIVGPKISIKRSVRGGGKIVIRFDSQDDIDRIVANLSARNNK